MRAPLSIALASLASACSTLEIGIGERIDLERCATFEPGRTSRAEVLAALGPPMALAPHGGGVAMLYEYVRLRERQLGIGFERIGDLVSLVLESEAGLPGIDLLKISLGRSGSQREAALFVFGAAGSLDGYGLASWSQRVGKGGSAQLLVSVQNVVDSEAFLQPPRSLTWGRELLEPLTAALNQPHLPDLELRAEPTHAGQRALGHVEAPARRR